MTTPRLPAVVPLDRDDDPIVNWQRGYAAALENTGIAHHQPQAAHIRDMYGFARFENYPANRCQCSVCRVGMRVAVR